MISLTEISTYHDFNEHCDFCILSFQTKSELKAHVYTHFKKKTCLNTQKILLLIADEWFELHINESGCTSERCNSEITSNAVPINEVKKEENCDENDLDNDAAALYDGTDISAPMKSESEAEVNFDLDANWSDSSSTSSKRKCKKFEPRAKKTKSKTSEVDSSSSVSPAKQTNVSTTTKKRSKTLNGQSTTTKSRRIKCKICKLKIAPDELIDHLQTRHLPKIDPIPTCEICGKTFSSPGNLRSHQYLHDERKRYICSYCGKEFVRNANLKEHINLHTVISGPILFCVLISNLIFFL